MEQLFQIDVVNISEQKAGFAGLFYFYLMPRVKSFDEEQVLQKAVELFWKKGYHATSMQDLVDYLGINRASLYDTFGGKKELFTQALTYYQRSNSKILLNLLKQQPEVKIGLRHLLESAIDAAVVDTDRKGCFMVNSSTELLPADTALQQMILANKENFEQALNDYLLSGQLKGQFSSGKDTQAIAETIFTFYNGLKVITKIKPDKASLLQQVNLLLLLLDN